MKRLLQNKALQIAVFTGFAAGFLPLTGLFALHHWDLFLISDFLEKFLICAVIVFGFFSGLILVFKIRRVVLRRIIIIVMAVFCILILGGVTGPLSIFSEKPVDIFISPDGKNKIVVLEGGFIDAFYTAYPVKYRVFYKRNHSQSVKCPDFWGGADAEVVWQEDSARIYIVFDKAQGRLEEESLLVSFG